MVDTLGFRELNRELCTSELLFAGHLSPTSFFSAHMDWASHLVNQPGRRLALIQQAWSDSVTLCCNADAVMRR